MKHLVVMSSMIFFCLLPLNGTERTQLGNGLTVVTQQDRSAPVVSVQLFVKVGSNNEAREIKGISHILEHMVFKGTAQRKAGQVAREVQAMGGYINAFTSYSMTSFYITVPKDNVEKAIDMLFDIVYEPSLPTQELEKEKPVIREEIRMRDDEPEVMMFHRLLANAYPKHPVGEPIIGYDATVAGLSAKQLHQFHREYYLPNNSVLVVAGDFDEEQLSSYIKERAALYKKMPVAPYEAGFPEKQVSPHVEVVPAAVEQVHFALGFRMPSMLSPETAALDVISSILGDGPDSRLYQSLRERKQLVHTISAGIFSGDHPGLLIISGTAGDTNVLPAVGSVAEHLREIAEQGVSVDELEQIKIQVAAAKIYEKEEVERRARELGMYEIQGGIEQQQVYERQLEKLTTGDIREAARMFFRKDTMSVVLLHPQSVSPSYGPDDVLAAVSSMPAGHQDNDRAEDTATPQVKEWVQEDGVKVILREDHSLPIVSFGAFVKSPFLQETEQNNGITSLALRSSMKGTASRDFAKIADLLERNALSLTPVIDKNVCGFTGSSVSQSFPLLFDVFSDILTRASFAEPEVEREQRHLLRAQEMRKEDSGGYALYQADKLLYREHPYRLPLLGERDSVERLTSEQVRGWFYRYFAPSLMTYVFTGDVTEEQVKDFMVQIEPSAGQSFSFPVKRERLTESMEAQFNLNKQQSAIVIEFPGPQVGSDEFYSLKVAVSLLSGMGSRLFQTLREDNSLVYSTYAYVSSGIPQSTAVFYAGVKPGNETITKRLILNELERLARETVPYDELHKAKESIKGMYVMNAQKRSNLVMDYGRFEILGMGWRAFDGYTARIDRITAGDVQRVAQKYLQGGCVSVVAGDVKN